MLGLNEINMLAYADGIVLVSPTWGVLQILLDKIALLLDRLRLKCSKNRYYDFYRQKVRISQPIILHSWQ